MCWFYELFYLQRKLNIIFNLFLYITSYIKYTMLYKYNWCITYYIINFLVIVFINCLSKSSNVLLTA